MQLTKRYFDDFVSRLRYHRRGEGVSDHCTRDAVFIVQKRNRIMGMDGCHNYDGYVWVNHDLEGMEADERTTRRLNALDSDFDRNLRGWEKVYYLDIWEYVSAHFTRESADAFIKRKGHDYEQLRVYVDCQVYCPEYNAIVDGILDGKIVLKEADA